LASTPSIDRWHLHSTQRFTVFSLPPQNFQQELAVLCSPLPGVRLANNLGTLVDLEPLPIR
jgi:hypothetical protein